MQLSKIVGAILNDLSTAQDLANVYSSQLSSKYKKNQIVDEDDNTLSNFDVPSAILCDISLDLKFIIQDINPDGFALNMEKTQENCSQIGRDVTHDFIVLYPEIADLIKKRYNRPIQETDEYNQNLFDDVKVAKRILTAEFAKRLEKRISQGLFRLCYSFFLLENDLTESEIKDTVTDKLEYELFNNTYIQSLLEINNFDDPQEVNRVEEMRKRLKEYCLSCAENAIKGIDIQSIIQKVRGNPNIEVIVHPLSLRKMPKETIQSLQISAKYDNHRWTISGTN